MQKVKDTNWVWIMESDIKASIGNFGIDSLCVIVHNYLQKLIINKSNERGEKKIQKDLRLC